MFKAWYGMMVVIRVDASISIGTGHVMRCLTVATELKNRGATIEFVCSEVPGNLCDFIEKKGFSVKRVFQSIASNGLFNWELDAQNTINVIKGYKKIDLLIIDHYDIDERWEKIVANYVEKIMVIDDLANRRHFCHVLLDYSVLHDFESRYDSLLPNWCTKLLGPNYVILRPEFYEARKTLLRRKSGIKRILVFFGGSDPTNETEKAVNALTKLLKDKDLDLDVDVVAGKVNSRKTLIKKLCSNRPNFHFFEQVDNMATLMAEADLAIGAGGITSYERLFMKLPSIVVCTADNQAQVLKYLGQEGYVVYLGNASNVDTQLLYSVVLNAVTNGLQVKNYEFNTQYSVFWEQLQDSANFK